MTGETPEARFNKRKPAWTLFEHQSAPISTNQHQTASWEELDESDELGEFDELDAWGESDKLNYFGELGEMGELNVSCDINCIDVLWVCPLS